MNRIDSHIDTRPFNHSQQTKTSVNHTRNHLVKEIGRLRLQLHQVQLMDHSQQRAEYLRREITTIKNQTSTLKLRS